MSQNLITTQEAPFRKDRVVVLTNDTLLNDHTPIVASVVAHMLIMHFRFPKETLIRHYRSYPGIGVLLPDWVRSHLLVLNFEELRHLHPVDLADIFMHVEIPTPLIVLADSESRNAVTQLVPERPHILVTDLFEFIPNSVRFLQNIGFTCPIDTPETLPE